MKSSNRRAHIFAKAAFSHAKKGKCMKQWKGLMETICVACDQKGFHHVLHNPTISKSQRLDALLACLKVTDPDQMEWLKILTEKKAASSLPFIPNIFEKHDLKDQQSLCVTITSHTALDKDIQKRTTENIAKNTNKQIIPTFIVNPKILGGITIEYDGKIITNTFAHALTTLTKKQV